MIVEACTGSEPGQDRTDALTGYVEGRGTWQFRMMLACADLGLDVIDHENFNFEKFALDPEGAIREQVGNEHVTQLIMAETDVDAEQKAAAACVASPAIDLIYGVPTLEDVKSHLALGRLALCNVNLQVLEGKKEREGHFLIVTAMDATTVTAHDPGPQGSLNRKFDRELFERAWESPSPEMANYIAVWK